MSDKGTSNSELSALQSDMVALQRDVASLIRMWKEEATDGAVDAAQQLAAGARRLYRNAAADGEESVEYVSQQIKDQPITALLIALGVGFISGRLLSR